jgi:hypothetical protein
MNPNMAKVSAVKHPSECRVSGWNEIVNEPERYSILDSTAVS